MQLQNKIAIRPNLAPWEIFVAGNQTLVRETATVNKKWRCGELRNSFNALLHNKLQINQLSRPMDRAWPPADFWTKTNCSQDIARGWNAARFWR